MIQAEFLKHQRWQLNKMKINLVRNLLERKHKSRGETVKVINMVMSGFSENNLPIYSRLVKYIMINQTAIITE